MIARLWWKEARIFWPLWVFVALIAVVGQWLVLHFIGDEARRGALGAMAIGWTCLYGFAVAAAAFAGEREGRTLLFLDTLPVSRIRLWGGKVSFALASTFALAVVLSGIAALGTDHWGGGRVGRGLLGLAVGVLLFEVLAWGLFWSAVTRTALTAAALAVCSMGVAGLFIQQELWFDPEDLVSTTWLRLTLALAAAGASAVVLTWTGPRRPAWSQRSPVRRHGPRIGRVDDRDRVQPHSPRPTWTSAAWSLAWLTIREAGPFWWRSVVLNLGLILLGFNLILLGFKQENGPDRWGAFLMAVNLVISLLAGVNVFGTEARSRSHRFLAHHGVSPGWTWAVKIAVWAGVLLSVWVILAANAVVMFFRREVNNGPEVRLYATVLINGFVIAQLCGMAIRRGITAALVATVALLAVMVPLGGLRVMEMLPSWGLVVISPALLFVGWAWSRDWLLDRPGPARLVRLALLLTTSLGMLCIGYVVHRVQSVPDLRPVLVRPLAVSVPSPDAIPKPNSADLYREAARRLTPALRAGQGVFGGPNSGVDQRVERSERRKTEPDGVWLSKNAEALALVRRASVLPRSPIAPIDRQTLFSRPEPIHFRGLAHLVIVSCRERRERGDLAGAWEDIAVLLRMARHWNGPVPVSLAFEGLSIEKQALGLATNWAVDSRQTSERLRASLAEYRQINWTIDLRVSPERRQTSVSLDRQLQVPFSEASDSIRVEARLAEQTLNLPRAELAERLLATVRGSRLADSAMAAWSELVTTPWEIARARRAFPLLFAAKVAAAGAEPYQRVQPGYLGEGSGGFRSGSGSADVSLSGADLDYIQKSTPLVQQLFPPLDALTKANDRNEVARRALVQILALRSWQVQHGGRLPDRLGELILSELDQLPLDPYANKAFGYIPSPGQPLLSLGQLSPSQRISTTGYRLLYSVGPDRQDDRAMTHVSDRPGLGEDIIFFLPEMVPARGGDAGKAGAD